MTDEQDRSRRLKQEQQKPAPVYKPPVGRPRLTNR